MVKGNSCPNFNSPEGKILLKKNKDSFIDATRVFIENNFEYPQDVLAEAAEDSAIDELESFDSKDVEEKRVLTKKDNFVKEAIALTEKRIKRVSGYVSSNPDAKELLKTLQKTLKSLEEDITDHAIIQYIKNAAQTSASVVKWVEKVKKNPENVSFFRLKQIQEQINSLSLLDTLRQDYLEDEDHKEEFKVIDEIIKNRDSIQKDWLDLSRRALAKMWSKDFNKIKEYYREEAEKQFNSSNLRNSLISRGYDKKQIAEYRREYIDNYVEANGNKIAKETEDYVVRLFEETTDISQAVLYAVNPRDMGHDIMSMAVEILDKADYDITQTNIEVVDKAEELNKAFVSFIGKKADPKDQYNVLLARDKEGNLLPELVNPTSANWSNFVSTYKDTPAWELREFLKNINTQKNEMLPRYVKLGESGMGLPKINKNTIERLSSENIFTVLKQGIIDPIKLRAEDVEFGNIEGELNSKDYLASKRKEIKTGEGGAEREIIPIHYRSANVEEKDLSYDIVSSFILDYQNGLNFKTKTELSFTLENLRDVVSNADIIQRDSLSKVTKYDMDSGLVHKVNRKGSNLERAITSLIRHRIYGIQVEGDPRVAKVAKSIGNYTSILGLAVNYVSGTANIMQGTTLSWIDAAGGKSGIFTKKNRARATKTYYADLPGILADTGQRVPKSKTNLLNRLFETLGEHNPNEKKFSENNRLKRMANTGSLMFMMNSGEHLVQSTVMYSILDNIKVLDSEGNFLDKNFKPTKNREEAIGLDQAYSVDKGKLVLNPAVSATEKTDGVTRDDMFKISRIIRRTNRDLYGNYDSKNKALTQRHALGALFFQMRGWMVPGIQRRWRGAGKILTKGSLSEMDDLDMMSYNTETDRFEEGTYTTFALYLKETGITFLNNFKKDVEGLKTFTMFGVWNTLTERERSNIRKTILELGLATAAFMVYLAFRDGDEPEDIYLAYFARRLYSETITFTNPLEATRTFRSPMMAVQTVEDGLNLVIQAFDPMEEYTTGKYADELKIKRRLMKMIPIWKQLDRDIEDSMKFLER